MHTADSIQDDEIAPMKTLLRTFLLLAVACGGLNLLTACNGSGDTSHDTSPAQIHHSSGRPVNPETNPGGQAVPGSRSTGANTQGTNGQQ